MGFQGAKSGFYFRGSREQEKSVKGISYKVLHEAGCNVCPLKTVPHNKTPHMDAYGSKEPIVYMLGGSPGKEDDAKGRPFTGPAGDLLKWRMPKGWTDYLRWNNVVRTRPPNNREPDLIEIECCRPSVADDIARTKPRAIFGFGKEALSWLLPKQNGIGKWCNRRIPVKVKNHVCWFYPIIHPQAILDHRRYEPKTLKEYGCNDEFVFQLNLDWAFRDVENAPDPVVHTAAQALEGIERISGNEPGDLDRVIEFLEYAGQQEVVGVDYETYDPEMTARPYHPESRILTAGVSADDRTVAFAFDHPGAGWQPKERKQLGAAWAKFLRSGARKAVHQLAFELEWSGHHFDRDLINAGEWDCTKGQAYVLDERQGMLSLDALCIQHFGLSVKAINNTDTKNLISTPLDVVLEYNGLDAKYHRLLCYEQDQRLVEEGLWDVYIEHVRRIKAAVLTQLKGVPVDQEVVEGFRQKYQDKRDAAEDELFAIPEVKKYRNKKGDEFKPGSHHDVSTVLHKLGYHDFESTDESELEKIDHPIAKALVDWRKPHKALSTYIEPVTAGHPRSVLQADGLLHPILSCDKTVTWRSSSEEPNIQNWDKRSEKVELRKQIRARPGRKIVSFDYAGIQARNVAMESKDEALIEAFWHEYDIHKEWMERLQKVYPKWSDGKLLATDPSYQKARRHIAKNQFVFPSFFGAKPKGISAGMGIPENKIEEVQAWFWDDFPDIKGWHTDLDRHYRKHGWITGLSGLRRRAPIDPNQMINAPIQADETIIVFDAMARLSEMDFDRFVATLMVHDDLTFEWYDEEIEENAEVVVKTMINTPYEWAHVVPIEVEMSVGPSWGDIKEVGKFASNKWNGIVEIKR